MQHKGLTANRWQQLSLYEQLGNIGSEVGRAIHASSPAPKQAAAYRALELFDLTLADRRWYHRGTEIARSREVVTDYLLGENEYNSDGAQLEQYFMNFALVARSHK